jgi:vacuolar protein sorting-associated protein 13A/C
MEPICSEAELQEFHPTRQMLGLAQQLVSQPLLSRVELNCLILEDASFESFDSLALRVGSHYFYQGLHSVYRLAVNRIGSLDELGNLSSAFSGLSGGIQQLYYEPRQGLVTSPRAFARGTLKGVGGLAGGVVGGTGIALFSFASAMGKHAGTLANAISMDSEWKHHRRAQQQRHAQSTRGGLLMGAQSLGQGLLEGGKGVFVKPVAGAMDDGARGFVKGLGTGLTPTPTPTLILPLPLLYPYP